MSFLLASRFSLSPATVDAPDWKVIFRVDVKALKTYQQVYIYLIPILGNLGFINIIVVVVRLRWFEKHLKAVGEMLP